MLGPSPLARVQAGLAATLLSLSKPADPSDLMITVLAEDKFSFREHLGRIAAPTLVIAGDRDPFYTPALFRETAAGIPNARLILYPGMGHPASDRQFKQDVLERRSSNQHPAINASKMPSKRAISRHFGLEKAVSGVVFGPT